MRFINEGCDNDPTTLSELKNGEFFEWMCSNGAEWAGAVGVVIDDSLAGSNVKVQCLDCKSPMQWSRATKVRRVELTEVKFKVIN